MLPEPDRRKSLQELEDDDWGEPGHSTGLVIECHQLRRVPLEDLTPGNCQMLLGQNIGAPFLVPLAIEWLRENPLLQARFYPCDLLGAVLGLDTSFWMEHQEFYWEMWEIVSEVDSIRYGLGYILPAENQFKRLHAKG